MCKYFLKEKLFGDYFVSLQSNLDFMANKKLNRLRVILAEKNLSNKWLAERLGRDQATISKWVTNTTQPNLEMLLKLSKVLEVELEELVRKEEID